MMIIVILLAVAGWRYYGAETHNGITNSIGMEFVLIPAGEFMMGTSKAQLRSLPGYKPSSRNWLAHETPQHKVVISKPFYMGKYEVTQAQWKAIMGNTPSFFYGKNRPVERVSWEDIQRFIQKLNERERHASGILCRLPTEAEWEYACRAGATTLYSFGDDETHLHKYAWYGGKYAEAQTRSVGGKKPNAWGLYDMHGNVLEWVHDRYDRKYYEYSPTVDPKGSDSGSFRVIRGGVWTAGEGRLRSAFRHQAHSDLVHRVLGFRCASSGPIRVAP